MTEKINFKNRQLKGKAFCKPMKILSVVSLANPVVPSIIFIYNINLKLMFKMYIVKL